MKTAGKIAGLGLTASVLAAIGSASAADLRIPRPVMAPEVFTPVVSGHLDLYGGATFFTGGEENADGVDGTVGLIGLSGRASIPLGGSFTGQFDLDTGYAFNNDDESTYANSLVAGLHISSRSKTHLFGIFGGGGTSTADGEEIASLWFLGLEGQLYMNNFTLYGQAGYLDATDDEDSDSFHNAWFARGVGRYFLSPNTLLQGEVSYARGKQDSGASYDMNIVGWGLKLEHAYKVPGLSVYLAYEGGWYSNGTDSDNGKFTEHNLLVGAKLRFGEARSLIDDDRRGATLDLPRFGRWVAGGQTVD